MNNEAQAYGEILGIISDLHKDVFGFRPSFEQYNNWSYRELVEVRDNLQMDVIDAIENEKKQQEYSVSRFEKMVEEAMELGASDRATAIRWVLQAEDVLTEDIEYAEYHFGLPYGYL